MPNQTRLLLNAILAGNEFWAYDGQPHVTIAIYSFEIEEFLAGKLRLRKPDGSYARTELASALNDPAVRSYILNDKEVYDKLCSDLFGDVDDVNPFMDSVDEFIHDEFFDERYVECKVAYARYADWCARFRAYDVGRRAFTEALPEKGWDVTQRDIDGMYVITKKPAPENGYLPIFK